jgi:lipocalin-like protein
MRKVILSLLFVVLPASALAQSLKSQMVGSWKLVSWNVVSGGVESTAPMAKGGATGIITYSPDGYMCVNIMAANRPKFPSPDVSVSTVNEKSSAFETFIGYCGRYEVNEQERFVTHQLDTSSYPNWTGSAQKRFVEMSAGKIKLSTPPILQQGAQLVHVLVWERAK